MRSGLHMLEEDLTEAVRELCTTFRVKRAHTLRSKGSPPGWPDEVIGQPGYSLVLVRELKRTGQNPTEAQRMWLAILAGAGFDVGVWRPADLLNGRIARELQQIRRSPRTGMIRWEEIAA